MLRIALIPAKSNSRRLPGKNLEILGDAPLFVHSVETALKCKQIDKVIVSSDSEEILKIAEDIGAVPFKRPIELCGDDIPNLSVCKNVVEQLATLENEVELMILLQPTHPFRTPKELDKAIIKLAENTDFDSLVSVAAAHRLRGSLNNNLWCQENDSQKERAQTKKNTYEITGHLFILRIRNTINKNLLFGRRTYAWPLPESWIDIDIDSKKDFLIAQAIISN
jgi:CMP-N-acetylneuraminic acid synthetase